MTRTTCLVLIWGCMLSGCRTSPTTSTNGQGNDLSAMRTSQVQIGDARFEAWIADTDETRQFGLMFVEASTLAPKEDGTHRSMLFVFEREQLLSFWMKDTITALDIAYADSGGRIVRIHTMAPLDTNHYPSGKPARFALEVRAGTFAELGIKAGDTIVIPADLGS